MLGLGGGAVLFGEGWKDGGPRAGVELRGYRFCWNGCWCGGPFEGGEGPRVTSGVAT
jgi:hypothetical protein